MSNDKKEPWRDIVESAMMMHPAFSDQTRAAVETVARNVYLEFAPVASPAALATNERGAHEACGHRMGMEDALGIAHGCDVDDTSFKAQAAALREHLNKIRAEGFAAGLQRARDLLDTDAAAAESYARGQAAEAEQVQARAVASATRAAVCRNGVALLDREIAALKGEGK